MVAVVIDASQVDALVRTLATAMARVEPELVKSIRKEAVTVKAEMVAGASGHRHLPALPASIEFTQVGTAASVFAGDGGQGNLAHIAAFGGRYNGPVWDAFAPAVPAQVRLATWAAKIGADLLDGRVT